MSRRTTAGSRRCRSATSSVASLAPSSLAWPRSSRHPSSSRRRACTRDRIAWAVSSSASSSAPVRAQAGRRAIAVMARTLRAPTDRNRPAIPYPQGIPPPANNHNPTRNTHTRARETAGSASAPTTRRTTLSAAADGTSYVLVDWRGWTNDHLRTAALPATVGRVKDAIEALVDEYARRYSEHDADAVTALCLWPFVAVREGAPIHLADRKQVRDHFATIMARYRGSGVTTWSLVEIGILPAGESACFATVRWNALAQDGSVLRNTTTTYQLLGGPGGWRFVSYTNHF